MMNLSKFGNMKQTDAKPEDNVQLEINPSDDTFIRNIQDLLQKPSEEERVEKASEPRDYSQANQSSYVDTSLNHRQNGFYVECGAFNGIKFSNTLFFEVSRQWSGLLIEANQGAFNELMGLHRKAYALNACLSPSNEPQNMTFRSSGFLGGLTGFMDASHKRAVNKFDKTMNLYQIQCFPLALIMQAMGISHIDYFSLDVEGPELEILQTIPWDHLTLDILTVEYTMWDGKQTNVQGSKDKLNKIRQYMASTGLYKELAVLGLHETDDPDGRSLDVVFQRIT